MKIISNNRRNRCSLGLAALIMAGSVAPQIANATIVQINTNMGVIEVNLFDNDTPATVANFLSYVNNGSYSSSVFHRSVPGFIVQSGGFTFNTAVPLDTILTNPPVMNEPVFSNVRGTIAMAKLGGGADPVNSATSQWFVNLADNSANLDGQNGGFTVFGQVDAAGMAVIDSIAGLAIFDFGGVLSDLPLQNFTGASFSDVNDTNLVIVNSIEISDTTVDSAAGLSPAPSTANSGGGSDPVPPPSNNGGGGGGGFGFLSLFALLLTYRFRQA